MKIGVWMPIEERNQRTASWVEIRDLAIATETAGFDSIWVSDHLLFRQGDDGSTRGIWEAWTILTGLAAVTDRVQLGTIVLCLPFRHPVVLAKMADTLDEVSGGRLILGIGAGWHEPEFEAFGLPFDHLASRFEEGAEIITSLLRTGEATVHGAYYRADDAVLKPSGPRTGRSFADGGIEIMISGNRPRMARAVVQYADSWNAAWIGDPSALASRRAVLDEALGEAGRAPNSIDITVGLTIRFPELEREFYGDHAPATDDLDPARVIVGEPADIAAIFRGYDDLGVTHLQLMYSPPNQPGLERLAEALRLYRGQ